MGEIGGPAFNGGGDSSIEAKGLEQLRRPKFSALEDCGPAPLSGAVLLKISWLILTGYSLVAITALELWSGERRGATLAADFCWSAASVP